MELQGQGSLGLGSSDKVAKGCGLGLGAWFLWAEEGAEHLPGPELAQKVRFLMGGEGGTQDSHREEGERGKVWRDFSMCVSDPVGKVQSLGSGWDADHQAISSPVMPNARQVYAKHPVHLQLEPGFSSYGFWLSPICPLGCPACAE